MANSADSDQLASELIWIYTVCKGRVYPGSAGLGLNIMWLKIITALDKAFSFFKQKLFFIFIFLHLDKMWGTSNE